MSVPPATLARRAAQASVAAALVLAGLKAWASWQTGSSAMLGSLADTSLDLVASLLVLIGVSLAARPPDAAHRFGHGKAEALATMAQVVLIALAAGAIGIGAIGRLLAGGSALRAPEAGIGVSLAAIVITLALVAFQRHVIARSGSLAIRTDSVHYQSDLYLNLAVIAALAGEAWLGLAGLDPALGLAIAGWLAWNAYRSAREAVDQLMDREWPEERRRALVEAAAACPGITRLHDLRTRSSGAHDFAQFHVDLPACMSVGEAHALTEALEAHLAARFPTVEFLIHVDPAGHLDRPGDMLAERDEFGRPSGDT